MTTYAIGQTISDTFSKLPFAGTVVGYLGDTFSKLPFAGTVVGYLGDHCLKVLIENPVRGLPVFLCARKLPVCISLGSRLPTFLIIEPGARNVTIDSAPESKPTPAYRKEIVYDRDSRDYAMYLDGELVGFERKYHQAEIELDRLVFELMSGPFFQDPTPEPVGK